MEFFVWPFVFVLLPLPWLVALFFKPASFQKQETPMMMLRVPFYDDVAHFTSVRNRPMSRRALFFFTLSWVFVVIAAARPFTYDQDSPVLKKIRNVVIAIDASGSMSARDFSQGAQGGTRLDSVKRVVDRFIQKRSSDRVGLILFGSGAYVYTPLSSDGKTLRNLLQDVDFGIVGDEATAIGDALALSVQQALTAPEKTRTIILLSDGFSNAGSITPDQAAALAARHQIKVYTIGLGGEPRAVQSFFGPVTVDPSKDLDEQTLNGIATATGGLYFRAKSESDLDQIYNEIDRLETDREETRISPRKELFYWPLSMAFVCLALTLFYREKVS